jgi:hypothetical protein
MDYIRLSSDKEEEIVFRSLKVGIIKDDIEYRDIIERLSNKHQYIKESIGILNSVNKKLKKYYKGKYKYGFCINEDKPVNDIKIRKNHKEVLYTEYLKVNDKFDKIKRQFEKEISYKDYFTSS